MPGEHPDAFLLDVSLRCPDAAAADRVLDGLSRCAAATRRAGPGVPVYLFHRMPVGPAGPPTVDLEYCELYLGAAAFWRHAESSEFLAFYRIATRAADRLAVRIGFAGAPSIDVVSRSLVPQLRARPLAVHVATLFDTRRARDAPGAEYLSLCFSRPAPPAPGAVDLFGQLLAAGPWVSVVVFDDPSQPDRLRLKGVRAALPPDPRERALWYALAARADVAGIRIGDAGAPLAGLLDDAPGFAVTAPARHVGYVLHPCAGAVL
ncbi:MAG: hypothetical protein OXH15_21730 [Gammaproteobacteria bacterium]|nr:hypothetical protein [Gammaproteobacteria bacterium]